MRGIKCRQCVNYKNEWCEKVTDSPDPDMVRDCQYFQENTNADRIRAMSDEELSWFLGKDVFGCMRTTEVCEVNLSCRECFLKWLQQPVKEETK